MQRGSLEHRVVISVAVVSGLFLAVLIMTAPASLSPVRRAGIGALSITVVRAVWVSIRLGRR
jgi:hypothetical protein